MKPLRLARASGAWGEVEMGPTVIYIHGNGNKAREDLLKRQWDEALFGQDMRTSSRMAYWAPLRYPTPLADPAFDEIDQMPESPLEAVTPPVVEPTESFIAQAVLEARTEAEQPAAPETPQAVDDERLQAWLRDMTYAADALTEGENTAPPPTSPFEALPFPRPLRTFMFRELVKRTFKDVYAYFFGGSKEAMRRVVREALGGIDGPVVMIGHSLGSIIAYDVLRERSSAALEVPLLVTVGSPLGVKEVQDLVERPLEVPTPVASWRNASDARDLVAMDHTLRPEYKPAERCMDLFVVNDSGNHHGIREYLRAVAVRQPVLELFRQEQAARPVAERRPQLEERGTTGWGA
jgi:hypothetical protein